MNAIYMIAVISPLVWLLVQMLGFVASSKELKTLTHFCPCIKTLDEPLKTGKAADANACGLFSLTVPSSAAVKYCPLTESCSVYHKDSLEYSTEAHKSGESDRCTGNPTEENNAYVVLQNPYKSTKDCEDFKQSGATENTYYKTSVRGKTVTVFCDMSSDPATTYYDMEAWTKFFRFEISWHKIRLLLDNCMTSVMTVDTKFSSEANPITGSWNGLLQGGARENLPGGHTFDLTPTPFRFTRFFGVEKLVTWGPSHTYEANTSARYSFVHAQSFDGYVYVNKYLYVPGEQKTQLYDYVTLQLNT